MKAGEIDLHKLKCLIDSVPSGVEVESITFDCNEIQLHIIAGTEEVKRVQYNDALTELQRVLKEKYLPDNSKKRLK